MNNRILFLLAVVAFSGAALGDACYLRDAINPDDASSQKTVYVVPDNGFKVVQCFPKDHGAIVRYEGSSEEKMTSALMNALDSPLLASLVTGASERGRICYLSGLNTTYVDGQTLSRGAFRYAGTKQFELSRGGTITLKCFTPSSRQEYDKALAELKQYEEERRRRDVERITRQQEKNDAYLAKKQAEAAERNEQAKQYRAREAHIASQVTALVEAEEQNGRDDLARARRRVLEDECIALHWQDPNAAKSICGLRIGMSRGEAMPALGKQIKANVHNDLDDDCVYELKTRFRMFTKAEVDFTNPNRAYLCGKVLRCFELTGEVNLDEYAFSSCKDQLLEIKAVLEKNFQITFKAESRDDTWFSAYCNPLPTGEGRRPVYASKVNLTLKHDNKMACFKLTFEMTQELERILHSVEGAVRNKINMGEGKKSLKSFGPDDAAFK